MNILLLDGGKNFGHSHGELNHTPHDGARFLTRAQNIPFILFRSSLFLLITSFCLFLVRYKHPSMARVS